MTMPEEPPQTAMLLTQREWELLGDLCIEHLMETGECNDGDAECDSLCKRIISAAYPGQYYAIGPVSDG
jgi:hypothetical protein